MSFDQDDTLDASTFPRAVSLFPLPNLVLFPGLAAPLHIFEPRYRTMIEDALAGDRLIGTVLLANGWEEAREGRPPIHEVACLGRIEAEERLPDGRYMVLLRGCVRVQILEEVDSPGPYRRAMVRLLPEPGLSHDNGAFEAVRAQLAQACHNLLGEDDTLQRVFGSSDSVGDLADRLAGTLNIPVETKQAVLSEPNPLRRAQGLAGFLMTAVAVPASELARLAMELADQESDEDDGDELDESFEDGEGSDGSDVPPGVLH